MPSMPQGWFENKLQDRLQVYRFRCRACRYRFPNRRTEQGFTPTLSGSRKFRWMVSISLIALGLCLVALLWLRVRTHAAGTIESPPTLKPSAAFMRNYQAPAAASNQPAGKAK